MAKITSYPSGTLNLDDYFISTIQWSTDRTDAENVTRNFKVSEVVNTILAALNIGTVTSIATASSEFISVTGGTITTTGTITANLSATSLGGGFPIGTPEYNAYIQTQFLSGDNIWKQASANPPSKVAILYNGTQLTADANSMNYTGNVTAVAANSNVTLNMPGSTGSSVDSVIAGTAISVNAPTGNVTITNTGVTQARAGGNITLSGGTGSVTVSTTANAGTVSSVSPGLGIATIANNTSNPEIDLEFTGVNNYISRSETPTTANPEDFIEFNQLSSSNVKSVEIGDIPPSILTAVKKYIDDEDANKVKNDADTYTSTEKALNMVSLTITEYNALVSGGTVDENTLYFIVGAGTAFTVNPVVTNNITGDVGYSINTTPSSVTGVSGTPYTFTTTVTVQPGGSFSGTNPVVTSDVINNSSGNPYNKAITVSGVYTAPAANSVRARLGTIALDQDSSGSIGTSNLAANAANLTYGGNVVGDVNPTSYSTSNPTPYSFASTVSITDTNSYEFTVAPTIIDAAGNLTPTTPNQDVDVTTYMHGTVALKQYTATATLDTSGITLPSPNPTYNWSIQSNTPGGQTGTITGLNQGSAFSWNEPTASVITPYTATPAQGQYYWSQASEPTFTDSGGSTITFPYGGTIAGANGAVTINIGGTINYEPILGNVNLTLKYQDTLGADNPTGSIVFNAPATNSNITLSPLGDGSNTITVAANGPYDFGAITATLDAGYYFSSAFVATPPQPSGTAPLVNSDINSQLTGAVSENSITTKLDTSTYNYTGAPAATYSANFTNSTPNPLQTTTGSGSGGTATDTGIATGVVSSTAGISKGDPALGDVVVKWVKNSITPPEQELSFSAGATIGGNYTFTSLVNSDTIEIQVVESDPADVVSTLGITTNIGGNDPTEFTIVGDQIGDTNTAKPGAVGQQFNFTPTPNTDYEFTTGPSYEVDGSVATMPYIYAQPLISSTITIDVAGDISAIIYTLTLGYINDITGGTAGVEYTISPASGTTRTGAVNAAYDFGSVTISLAADYQVANFSSSQEPGTLPLSGNIPTLGGGLAVTQRLAGVISPIIYTITLAYANSITGGTAGVEYTLSPASGSTRTGAVGAAYSFGTITATPATGYYFSTPFNATQTAFSLPINGTMPSGGGTASQTLTGVIAPARATIESVCVAVPVTTAITYATSFAPGGSGATRTLTTTGTQTLSNSNFEYGNGTVTVTVNRTAPSSSAQDGGSIQWNLNGVQQGALQTITIGATISYSRTITGVTAGDTISVSIAEG